MLKLLRRVSYLLRQRRVERDLAQEVEFHRTLHAEQLQRNGLNAESARREAPE
jgi:hypothetical protein